MIKIIASEHEIAPTTFGITEPSDFFTIISINQYKHSYRNLLLETAIPTPKIENAVLYQLNMVLSCYYKVKNSII